VYCGWKLFTQILGIFRELWLKCAECQMGFLEQPVMQIANTTSLLAISDCCGCKLYTELLRILRKLRLKGAMSDLSLEQLALRTLKSTIFANPRTQNHFRSIGGVEVLLDGLGTPSTPSKRYECGTDDFSSVDKGQPQLDSQEPIGVSCLNRLLDDFQMQTLSLQVLREAMYPHNLL
jgi:hypothetical protein